MKGFLKKYCYVLPSLCFLALVFWLCLSNLSSVITYTWWTLPHGYVDYTQGMEDALTDSLEQKYDLIELNSSLSRWLGFGSLNEVTLLANGHLTDMAALTAGPSMNLENLKAMTDMLEALDIGYLCVPVPGKAQFYDCPTLPGYSRLEDVPRQVHKAMEAQGIRALDMNGWYAENGWTMDQVYSRTDHHWLPQSAFAACQQIMDYFAAHYGLERDETMEAESWTVECYEDWFLGSHGRRTGSPYAGRDPLYFLYPNFPTDYRIGRINSQRQLEDMAEDDIYDRSYLEVPGSYENNPYCLYLGGDYPLVSIENPLAVNDKCLIIVGDSYKLPVDCVLATQFTQVYHFDPRYYQDGSFAAFVQQIQPDCVLFLAGTNYMMDADYGVDSWGAAFGSKTPGEAALQLQALSLEAAQSQNDYRLLEAHLAPGSYRLDVGQLQLRKDAQANPQASDLFVQVSLVDLNSWQVLSERYFLTGRQTTQQWYFTAPENPAANYALVVYNGVKGRSLGNETQLTDLVLYPYV